MMKQSIRSSMAMGMLATLVSIGLEAPTNGQGVSDDPPNEGLVGETGLGPTATYSRVGPGCDFSITGVTTRNYQVGQTDPFTLVGPSIPGGATIVTHFVCWSYLLNGTPASTNTITINSQNVTGNLVGTGNDLCWQRDGGAVYLASGANLPINLGSSNSIGSASDSGTRLGEGITILTIYEVPCELDRLCDVFVGYASTEDSNNEADATLTLSQAHSLGQLRFACDALDGQESNDDLFAINTTNVNGLLPGTFSNTHAWKGLIGPLSDDNLYDLADGDISVYLTPPTSSFTMRTHTTGDCIAHSIAVASFRVEEPCPGDIAPAGGDHQVNVNDLLLVIGTWGPCPTPCPSTSCPSTCPGDVVPNCAVDVSDLNAVIALWGACP